MSHFVPCLSCQRHVRVSDGSCPFCGVALSPEQRASAPPQLPRRRLGRAALFTFGATLVGAAACSDGSGGTKDAGRDTPAADSSAGGSGGSGSGGSTGSGGSGGGGGSGGSAGSGGGGGSGGSGGGGSGGTDGGGGTDGRDAATDGGSGGQGGIAPPYGIAPAYGLPSDR